MLSLMLRAGMYVNVCWHIDDLAMVVLYSIHLHTYIHSCLGSFYSFHDGFFLSAFNFEILKIPDHISMNYSLNDKNYYVCGINA